MFWRRRKASDFSDEVRSHIEIETQRLREQGLSEKEARSQARRGFGNMTGAEERFYESRRGMWREAISQDFRFAARMLRKSPGFTAVAILTLALGIGANTAIFSVVYAGLIQSLPFAQPERLISLDQERALEHVQEHGESWVASYPDVLDWRRQSTTLQSIAGFSGDSFGLRGAGEPQLIFGAQVSSNFFATLGVRPVIGRDFSPSDEIAAGPKVAILTYECWRSRFGGDPQISGRKIQLDANTVDIIGVLPREFQFGPAGRAEVWVPLHLPEDMSTRRNLRWLATIARISPGSDLKQARAEMESITAALAKTYPQEDGTIQIIIGPLRDRLLGKLQPLLLILFGAVGFVLLIACANVANLVLVRAGARRREFAIRAALGASRARMLSLSLAESLLLASAGGALGFLGAQWATRGLIAAIPAQLLSSAPFLRNARPNLAVFAFLCGVAALTGILFGLAPALQTSRQKAADALREESRGTAGTLRTRLRDTLVAGEIAFCLVLLVGAGLMAKSFSTLLHRNPGFDTQNLLTFDVNLPDAAYPKPEDPVRFDAAFRDRARALPGVTGIANTSVVPLTGNNNSIRFVIEGRPVRPGNESECLITEVSNGYFAAMKIPLLAGRVFNDTDDSATADKHVIVTQAWVKENFNGQSPVGKRIRFTYSAKQKFREIVGVVGDVASAQLDSPETPGLYLPFQQSSNSYISYVARTSGNPASALAGIRDALRQMDPQLFLIQPATLEEIVARSPAVFLRRYPSYLIGGFAVLAMLLATIGLYGLIAYSVSQRTREFGIRMAVGATRSDILSLVLRQGLRLALIGVAAGIVAALALTRLMDSLLFGVRAFDPGVFAGVAALLALVATAACYLPARRAVSVDPMVALRHE